MGGRMLRARPGHEICRGNDMTSGTKVTPPGEKTDVRRRLPQRVMAGLDPAIPAGTGIAKEAITRRDGAGGDGRVKPGHDVCAAPVRTDRESIVSAAGITRRGMLALGAGAFLPTVALGAPATEILNVSYDPTRELYKDVNTGFARVWADGGNGSLDVRMSHGGSGAQARSVIDGL